MRIILLFSFVLLLNVSLHAQFPEWIRMYNGGLGDDPTDMILDKAGNIIVTGGSTNTTVNGMSDFATVKYSPSGMQLWASRYDSPLHYADYGKKLAADSQGNIYAIGQTGLSGLNPKRNILLIKYNASGVEQWIKEFDSGADIDDRVYNMKMDSAGFIYVLANSGQSVSGKIKIIKYNQAGTQLWVMSKDTIRDSSFEVDKYGNSYLCFSKNNFLRVIKYDSSGVNQWESFFPVTGSAVTSKLYIDYSGSLYVGGKMSTADIVKFNSMGVMQWSQLVSGNGYHVITFDRNNNLYIACDTAYNNLTYIVLKKYSPAGVLQWRTFYDYGDPFLSQGSHSLTLDNANNMYLLGTYMQGTLNPDALTAKFNANGEFQWVYPHGGTLGEEDPPVKIVTNGNSAVYSCINLHNTNPDYGVIKFGIPTSISPVNTDVPAGFTLYQNYPNPFNPETNIKFDLPEASNIKITIYNSLGKEIQVLADEHKQAGSYEVKFNAEGYAGGVYFYRLAAGSYSETKKFILIK